MRFANVVKGAVSTALLAGAALAQAAEPVPVRILLNWFAQPDQAGYWQAQQGKLGRDAGVAIAVQQGGPRIQTIPQVASGQAEFGIANADDLLLARARGAPVRAVLAHLDHVPYTLVYHRDPAVKSIRDLRGRTFAVNLGSAYWEWLRHHYRLDGARTIPVSGDLSLFRNDPSMVQQGYSLYLPARMAAAGLAVQQITLASLGYRSYGVLFTTDDMIRTKPAVVRATVAAVRQGWRSYAANPAALRPLLTTMNQQIPPALYDTASRELIDTQLAGDPARFGCMSAARWRELAAQLQSVKFLPAGFDEKTAFDNTLIPGCGP
ncbi:ABC transporter substrate-binding protein [Massilia sp. METH4]|uniref:ABC transporter substrate-binding protein n=1 Tax=Massilia sp. METH4 TaxID=3123041 RepID=UPI0030CAB5AA